MNTLHSSRRPRLARASGPAILVLLAAVGVATVRAEVIERVLVKVNADILTQTDLEGRQSAIIRARKLNPESMTNADLNKVLAEITPQIIVDAVDELLLLQRGKELGYRLSDEKFKQVLENIKKENHIETEEAFQSALKTENLTLAELRLRLEKSMIIQQVQGNEVLGRISITEAEAKAYYDAHQSEFLSPASMMLREILIAVPTTARGFSAGQDEAAKAKADALYARIVAGESFEKVVTDSSDAASKANAGLIGPFSLSDLSPALRQQVEPLKAGQVTPVVRTQTGYQIFKVDALTEAKLLPWEQVREDIGNRVANTKQAAEFTRYMQKLRGQAVIEWKNAELKKLFEQKVAEEAVVAGAQVPPDKK
jgi:peptidyl-prolyl cis-trans isomerase SurA